MTSDKAFGAASKKYIEEDDRQLVQFIIVDGERVVEGDEDNVNDVLETDVVDQINQIMKKKKNDKEMKMVTTMKKGLPKLIAPLDLENEDRFWTDIQVKEQIKTYLLMLNWKRSNGKPLWWPKSLNFDKYKHYSYSTMRQNKLIIQSILMHFKLDPNEHCLHPVVSDKKQAKSKKNINKGDDDKGKNPSDDDDLEDDTDSSSESVEDDGYGKRNRHSDSDSHSHLDVEPANKKKKSSSITPPPTTPDRDTEASSSLPSSHPPSSIPLPEPPRQESVRSKRPTSKCPDCKVAFGTAIRRNNHMERKECRY
jgi:hypothetical protein